jgi:hypothetical protein
MGSSVVLVQDWLTLRGLGGGIAVNFDQCRPDWLEVGDAQGAVLSVQIHALAGTTPPTLKILTAVSEDGPWETVASYTSPGDDTIFLRRDPNGTSADQMMGIIRWRLDETMSGGAWYACFRITAVLERA